MARKSFDPTLLSLLDDSIDPQSIPTTFQPNKINVDGMAILFQNVPESVKNYARSLRDDRGWKFYSVNQTRGACYYREKVITIPMWAIDKGVQYKTWYISHELAHAYDTARSNHGDPFMQQLKVICPSDCIHFELGYKPRNAARNGIILEL